MTVTLTGRDRSHVLTSIVEMVPDFPLVQVLPPEPDIRDRVGPEYKAFFEQLVADIAERGVQQPILTFREGDQARVWDGWTRCLASRMAGRHSIPALLHPRKPDGKERLLGALQSNAMRLDMDDFEYATVYQQIWDECGVATQSELAAVVKASPSLVSKRLRLFSGIPQDIRGVFGRGSGKLGGRAAYAISRLESDDDKREIARLAVERELKVEAIEHWCGVRTGKKAKRAKVLKLSCAGVTATITGNPLDALRAFIAKAGEAVRKLEKDALPVDLLPALMK